MINVMEVSCLWTAPFACIRYTPTCNPDHYSPSIDTKKPRPETVGALLIVGREPWR